jgi:hypothetical protein
MTKTLTMGLATALMAFSALNAPGALAKDGGKGGHAHQWKGSTYRDFRIGHDGHNRGFHYWKGYKFRNFHVGYDGDGRVFHYGKFYKDRRFRIGHDGNYRGFGYWPWKKAVSPVWYRKYKERTDD